MRIDGKDGLMKKIYTGKSLDELKALAISEIKELGVDEADIKITVVEEPVKKLFGKKGDYKIEVEFETVTEAAPAAADETAPAEAAEAAPAVTDADHTEKVAMAAAYLEKVLTALGVEDFKVNIIEKEDITVLDICWENVIAIVLSPFINPRLCFPRSLPARLPRRAYCRAAALGPYGSRMRKRGLPLLPQA